MISEISIRHAKCSDFATLAEVMHDAIRNGPSEYTEAQRAAWSPQPHSGESWTKRLEPQTIRVAENAEKIVGFVAMQDSGYIDLAFVIPTFQRRGVLRHLIRSLEGHCAACGTIKLYLHASLMAKPAFAAMGFLTLQGEIVVVNDQSLIRYTMAKQLSDA